VVFDAIFEHILASFGPLLSIFGPPFGSFSISLCAEWRKLTANLVRDVANSGTWSVWDLAGIDLSVGVVGARNTIEGSFRGCLAGSKRKMLVAEEANRCRKNRQQGRREIGSQFGFMHCSAQNRNRNWQGHRAE
jgi:hypothetical protein